MKSLSLRVGLVLMNGSVLEKNAQVMVKWKWQKVNPNLKTPKILTHLHLKHKHLVLLIIYKVWLKIRKNKLIILI